MPLRGHLAHRHALRSPDPLPRLAKRAEHVGARRQSRIYRRDWYPGRRQKRSIPTQPHHPGRATARANRPLHHRHRPPVTSASPGIADPQHARVVAPTRFLASATGTSATAGTRRFHDS